MYIGRMSHGGHISRPVPCRPHTELLREYLELSGRSDPADLAQMHTDEVNQMLRDQGLPFCKIVEQLSLGYGDGALLPQPSQPFCLLKGDRILQEEQMIRLQGLCQLYGFYRGDPLMNIMYKLDLFPKPAADPFKQPDRIADVFL